ncbi:hypothetical protein QLQ12_37555 [Actinoplanes sp. NEAU-A12]|uniref:N,N-dimethylformamidase beta subunit-like C-terminal domain-containing protein n=1 Tax=Actinoplanes sandaracinus TaxID=3045177 RepID=A0ABT6WXI3_9ACTN|nr:N,N-dimethylformamidase beta subunit family domain-containing protein [Actinoplanes sandaracinus]MDI6104315.1 hypothetical protein [Actinoplanes sandaracinus]
MRLRIRDGAAVADAAMPAALLLGAWNNICIELSPDGADVTVGHHRLRLETSVTMRPGDPLHWTLARVPWRSEDSAGHASLDGKIANVEVSWRDQGQAVARHRWDFAPAANRAVVPPLTPQTEPLVLHQAPTRAVTGPHWTGETHHWPDAPGQWDAIHFHRDDLEDAGWPVATTFALGADLPTGVYGIRLKGERNDDVVPFVVGSAHGARKPEVRVLLPTMTYLAYANEPIFEPHVPLHRGWWDDWAERLGLLSLYNWHADGSGVSLASTRRPLLNMRPDHRYWLTGAPHGLSLDLQLLKWLQTIGFDAGLLTDHELDADPDAALDGTRVLVTGSHPEYWTRRMMTAMERFLGKGGRLAYLGGNGFAAMVGVDRERPHLLELRRRASLPGLWDASPGELGLATTGEVGGYWRHHSPSPRSMTGLDSAGMGFTTARPYRRTTESDDPACAFVFDGVTARVFGERSAVLGAAGGYEVDSVDFKRGTPSDTRVLATAAGFDSAYVGLDQSGIVRSDVVLRMLRTGGAVFGVGSIAWCGSLGGSHCDVNIERVTENVLRRFADPTPFLGSEGL